MSTDSAHQARAGLILGALGVVYGDIGTSPLYAIRECFSGSHSVPVTHDNVLGVLSLIIYALLIVISLKYIAIVMRADNRGEGGILALTSLLPKRESRRFVTPVLVLIGLFGASLIYGDAMITPAITVLSAMEGADVVFPGFRDYTVPATVAILVALFSLQRSGSGVVGWLFGPVMLVWFAVLAAMGLSWMVQAPEVLWAFDPRHGFHFFVEHQWHGLAVLGAVCLVITGGEALYADMGHFGRFPIRAAWFAVVLPALLLNYFGQAVLLLKDPTAAANPFFLMAPEAFRLPLVALSTMAAIIASQAMISGVFSLTVQSIQLGYCPRLDISHTSKETMGQIYLPQVNWMLFLATTAIVVSFGTSTALAAAYGIAVTMTMLLTTILLHVLMTERWQWPTPLAYGLTGVLVVIDGSFFTANLLKLFDGGWLPLLIGAVLFTLRTTWKTGRTIVARRLTARALKFDEFVDSLDTQALARVPGSAVFMTAQPSATPPALAHNIRHNRVLHERVISLQVTTMPVPYVSPEDRVEIRPLGRGIFEVVVRTGFMEEVDVPKTLAREAVLRIDDETTYFLGRETLLVTDAPGMASWREHLFAFMARNAGRAAGFFRLPPDRIVELGVQVEI